MSFKVVVIISTGESEKALTGLMYARNAMQRGWMNDVKVIFFGPSERLLIEDERVAEMAKEICSTETSLACKFISDRDGVSEK